MAGTYTTLIVTGTKDLMTGFPYGIGIFPVSRLIDPLCFHLVVKKDKNPAEPVENGLFLSFTLKKCVENYLFFT
jgi:hypothetical protein